MKLFEINKEIEEFEFQIDEDTGEILNIMQLDELNMMKKEKEINIALFIKNLDAEELALKNEYESMYKRMKAVRSKKDSLKKYLSQSLQGEKINDPKVSVTFRKSRSVVITDSSKVPERYLKKTEVIKEDKKLIASDQKNGIEVPGCELVENVNIIIK